MVFANLLPPKAAWAGALVVVWPLPAPAAALPSPLPDRAGELTCLADAIAYEAGSEPAEGQEAVAQVILNRLRDPAYPKSVCAVVYQGSSRRSGCQFSFTCDGSTGRALPPRVREQAQAVAKRALDGELAPTVGAATHYHADYVSPPWAAQLIRITAIGRHIFYERPGGPPLAAAARPPAGPVLTIWGVPVAGAVFR